LQINVASFSASPLDLTLQNGAWLNLNGQDATFGSLAAPGTGMVTNTSTTAKTLTVGATNADTVFAGSFKRFSDQALNTINLTKVGTGTMTLSGDNSVTSNGALGVVTVSAGTLRVTQPSGMGSGSIALGGASAILDLRNNGAGNNGTISYGNNITSVTNGATINVQNNGANTGNTVTLGTLAIAGSTLNVTGTNGSTLPLGATTLSGAATLNPTTANLSVASISGTQNLTLGGTATGNSVTGVIGTGTGTLTKSGTGTWTLAGANTYTGATTLSAGTLNINNAGTSSSNSAIGTGTLNISPGTTIDNTSGAAKTLLTNNAVTFPTGGATDSYSFFNALSTSTSNLNFGSGTTTLNLPSSNSATQWRTINLNGTGTTLTMGSVIGQNVNNSGVLVVNGAGNTLVFGSLLTNQNTGQKNFTINGTGNVTINGAITSGNASGPSLLSYGGTGTLTLNGSSAYTGATSVTAGKLTIGSTGTINGTSGVSIGAGEFNYNSGTALSQPVSFSGSGGILSGSGTITPAVNVTAGNTLSPGNSIGSLSFGTGLTLAGNYAVQLGTPGATPVAGVSDRAVVTGALSLTGSTLVLSDNAGANSQGSAGGGAYQLITFSTRTGQFASVTNPLSATLHESVVYNSGSVDLNVYRLAAATAPATSKNLGNVRVGTSLTGSDSVTHSASGDGFSELLKASVTGDGTGFTGVAGGANGTVNYSITTSTAGAKSGSASVELKSTGTGSYGDTTLSTTTVALSGTAYDYASPTLNTAGPVDFGNVHVGATQPTGNVSITNTTLSNASYQDSLNAGATTNNGKVTGNSFTSQTAGTTGSLTLTADTTSVGSLASTVTLD
ncbi:MAG: autotransporter-associated beta strand repeat-containing protein, partial [Verrucomicrobiota bacterium]